MIKYQAGLEDVWFDRLTERVSLAPVFVHVPDNTPPPVVMIADVNFDNQGTKDSPLLLFTVSIVSLTQGHQRKPLNELQAQVEAALNGWTPDPRDGLLFGQIMLQSGTGMLMNTGDGAPVYYGEQIFMQFVQAA